MAPPVVLVISGLDPSGAAGFLLDARVIAAHGAFACGAVTALTVQDTRGARSCQPVSDELLAQQLPAVLSDIEVAAVKIGLVPTEALARTIASALAQTAAPVVWDPVFGASAGAALLSDTPGSIADALASDCTLLTPNLVEASLLVGERVETVADARAAATRLAASTGAAVLIKGGHFEGAPTDVLAVGDSVSELVGARVDREARGTGCYLSSAIAARLASGAALADAVAGAKARLRDALESAAALGSGAHILVD